MKVVEAGAAPLSASHPPSFNQPSPISFLRPHLGRAKREKWAGQSLGRFLFECTRGLEKSRMGHRLKGGLPCRILLLQELHYLLKLVYLLDLSARPLQ